MKFTILKNTDAVHITLEKITNPALPEREALDGARSLTVMLTDEASDAIGVYSSGMNAGRPKKGEEKGHNKKELCAMLLAAYCKNWRRSAPDWQAKELQELRKICVQLLPESRRKIGSNIGRLKLTKQLMAAAILQRVVITQDLKDFFEKTL
jgi:hypothetical protein